ncbi:MAG: PEP-CTERM sorting domain-containing protein [Stellaceae bacterium]
MKRLFLTGAAFLAIGAAGSAANATLFDFTYSGSLVDFTVPTTDTYQILAFGAQGGSGGCSVSCGPADVGAGGRGAEIGGIMTLTAGEVLQIAVGGMGGLSEGFGGGGGGGSFVVGPGNTPLVIAGGGGGGGASTLGGLPGGGGVTGPNGAAGAGVSFPGGAGGTGGNGGGAGSGASPGGGGGGGFLSAGGTLLIGAFQASGGGGGGFPDLIGGSGLGGGEGGFGGGGGGGGFVGGGGGGGGGGGYSGGGGGGADHSTAPGGGGGSFDAGIDQILVADFQMGNGEVIITEIAAAVPEPSSIALLCVGLAGLAVMRRRSPKIDRFHATQCLEADK